MSKQTGIGAILGYRGGLNKIATPEATVSTTRFSLLEIRPDPGQPRKLLTLDLQARLVAGDEPTEILTEWLESAKNGSPAQRRSAENLIELARTIQQHGLIHAITLRQKPDDIVMPDGVDKLIVTGERRWWAHVFLLLQDEWVGGRDAASTIAGAILPDDVKVRAVQLIENLARTSLNAVERAEGLDALRTELSEGRKKKATWTEVEKTLGIDRTYRWRIQQVLKLGDQARDLIVWHGLPEIAIRPISTKLQAHPDLQVKALKVLISWREASEESGNKRLDDLIKRLLKGDPKLSASPTTQKLAGTAYRHIGTTLKAFDALDEQAVFHVKQRAKSDSTLAQQLITLRDKLNDILTDVGGQ